MTTSDGEARSPSPTVRSNAFNFLSFVETGVDPRTGLYTVSVSLPDLPTNGLTGPVAPIGLAFSPMQPDDRGIGIGWSLRMSAYDRSAKQLRLSTGELYKATDTGSRLVVEDQKLQNFHVEKRGNDLVVVYKSGVTEVLSNGNGLYDVYLPSVIRSPEGRSVNLSYSLFLGHRILSEVRDDSQRILTIERNTGQVRIAFHPDTQSAAVFTLVLQNDLVTQLRLPVENAACWRFQYRMLLGLPLISRLESPTGGVDILNYQENGHQFPVGAPQNYLPYLIEHIRAPGAGQPPMRTVYRYSSRNFLGRDAPGLIWSDDVDNLYKVLADYQYESTEMVMDDAVDTSEAVRITRRVYNRFHLLVTEEVNQQGHVRLQDIEYHEHPGRPFAEQAPWCQLPHRVVKSFYRTASTDIRRDETVSTTFDEYGNLLQQVDAAGMIEEYTYYGAEGEADCPTDPFGFVRFVKEKRVTPAPSVSDTSVIATRCGYAILPSFVSGQAHIVQTRESRFELAGETERLLAQKDIAYIDTLSDPSHHGRVRSETVTYNGFSTQTFHSYAIQNEALKTTTTVVGFDGTQRNTVMTRSILTGRDLEIQNEDGATVRFEYDALGRVIGEITAPGTEFEAKRHYTYALAALSGDPVDMQAVDVNGIATWTYYDGHNRTIRIEREDADQSDKPLRIVYEAQYDARDQLTSEKQVDWLEGKALAVTRVHGYDDWGQRCCTVRPGGVKEHHETDPVALAETAWIEAADTVRSGKMVTTYNLFGKPESIERFDVEENTVSVARKEYDGLGHCVREFDPAGNSTRFAYDAFDRLTQHILPDGTTIEHAYALHDGGDHPVALWVSHAGGMARVSAGEQTFDGLGRLLSRTVGGRRRVFSYQAGQSQPTNETTPAGSVIEYRYEPRLTREPVRRIAEGVDTEYGFHPKHAGLIFTREAGADYQLEYFPSGSLQRERWNGSGDVSEASHAMSLGGLPLGYTDRFGRTQQMEYDNTGRLAQIRYASLTSTLDYDSLGRLAHCTTRDAADQIALTIAPRYDDLGREIERTLSREGTAHQILTQRYTSTDQIAKRTLRSGSEVLRDETYEYDALGRLVAYQCTGTKRPRDPYGKDVTLQHYEYDVWNNIVSLKTGFDGGEDIARFQYENSADPTQLTGVSHSHPDYPASLTLHYDVDGNLTKSGELTYRYDALGRLEAVAHGVNGVLAQYRYDGLDRVATIESTGSPAAQRTYREGKLASEVQGDVERSYLHEGRLLLAQHDGGPQARSILYGTDFQLSVLRAVAGDSERDLAYTPYGFLPADATLPGVPGFNGEPRDPIMLSYLSGNGRRLYDPALMRFCSPDSLSPFGGGGLNAYAYCLGDPVNRVDPTGQLSWQAILGIVLSAAAIVVTVASLGTGAAISAGMIQAGAALTTFATVPSATVSGVVATAMSVTGIVESAAAIASASLSEKSPEAAGMLGWVSLGLGIGSAAYGAYGAVTQVARAATGTVSKAARNIAVARSAVDVVSRTQGAAGQFGATFASEMPAWVGYTMTGLSLALTGASWGGAHRQAAHARSTGRYPLALAGEMEMSPAGPQPVDLSSSEDGGAPAVLLSLRGIPESPGVLSSRANDGVRQVGVLTRQS